CEPERVVRRALCGILLQPGYARVARKERSLRVRLFYPRRRPEQTTEPQAPPSSARLQTGRLGATACSSRGPRIARSMMRARNRPPFLFAATATSLRPPEPSATLVVKGSFRLRPGEPVTPLDGLGAQGTLSGDVFAKDDDERRGALLYASDFAD